MGSEKCKVMSNFKPKKLKHCVAYRNVIKKMNYMSQFLSFRDKY